MKVPAQIELSVILAAARSYDVISKTIYYLSRQSISEQLELVIVTPSKEKLAPDENELAQFGACIFVETAVPLSIGKANAAGIRRASARVVAMAEDHAFPDKNWASGLVSAHQSPWAAVGPVVDNGNPGSFVSWADFLIGYGPWMAGTKTGEKEFLPGHNTSYKRDVLLEYGPGLEAMMEAETVLHWDLKSKGFALRLDDKVTIQHWNFSRLSSWLAAMFHGGRVFAGSRTRQEHWTVFRRLLYIAGSPLIPIVRFARLCPKLPNTGKSFSGCIVLSLVILLGLLLDGLGQGLAYAFGTGNAKSLLLHLEYDRGRHLNAADRARWRLLGVA